MTESTRPEGLNEENSLNTSKEEERTMSSEEKEQKRITRREFVRGAAVGAAGVAAVGVLASCAQEATPCPTAEPCPTAASCPSCPTVEPCPAPWLPDKWDYETDVVVVGLGAAGAVAAISAYDAGAEVIVIEKAPIEGGGCSRTAGANTAYCEPEDVDGAAEYLYTSCNGSTPMDVCVAWAKGISEIPGWLTEKNIPFNVRGETFSAADFPNFPGASALKGLGVTGYGLVLWELTLEYLQSNGVEVLFDTPGKELIQDPTTKEILGIIAEKQGRRTAIKARRGIVLCTGGFECNEEMKENYMRPAPLVPTGWRYNTGDGIKMAQAVGADLWHMNMSADCGPTIKLPGSEMGFPMPSAKGGSHIWVSKYGTRFVCENPTVHIHRSTMFNNLWDWSGIQTEANYLYCPFYLIFDEKCRLAGPLPGSSTATARALRGFYTIPPELGGLTEFWSDDNSREVEKGWIKKGNTIKELAEAIGPGIDGDQLVKTVSRWNEFCAKGVDLDFDRPAEVTSAPIGSSMLSENLVAIDTPPYYSVEMWPGIYSTAGGPMKNGNGQILDTNKDPIPRLYEAGVLGGTHGHVYSIFGQNFSECFAFGMISGRNVAAEEPWS